MKFEIISEKELIKAYKDKRPKGKWLRHQAGLFDYHYCSICEEQAKVLQDGGGCELLSNYCPNCGADMRGEE